MLEKYLDLAKRYVLLAKQCIAGTDKPGHGWLPATQEADGALGCSVWTRASDPLTCPLLSTQIFYHKNKKKTHMTVCVPVSK